MAAFSFEFQCVCMCVVVEDNKRIDPAEKISVLRCFIFSEKFLLGIRLRDQSGIHVRDALFCDLLVYFSKGRRGQSP